jgi:hypothetical protein
VARVEIAGCEGRRLIHAARVNVTDRTARPGFFEVFALLGREDTVGRIERLVGCLPARSH